MNRSALALLVALHAHAAGAFTVETLSDAGPLTNRINLVIIGEGYRDVDQTQLTTDAKALIEGLFSIAPYKQYAKFFNVKLIHALSNQTGADQGSYGATRDTRYGARYFCSSIERLICVDTALVHADAAAHVPEVDLVLVLVNDPKYGGSGGAVAVVSLDPQSKDIARHELGHTLAGLADEYDAAYPGYPACPQPDCVEPNVTLSASRSTLKWKDWVEVSTPLPTPETNEWISTHGAFEGARYLTTGIYRPRQGCLMSRNNRPFCDVCTEAMVKAFYGRVAPVDTALPLSGTLLTCGATAAPLAFEVKLPSPEPDSFSVQWTLNGALAGTGPTLSLPPTAFIDGTNTVHATVRDATGLVRSDPSGLLVEQRSWTVTADLCAPRACDQSATCSTQKRCVRSTKPNGAACASCAGDAMQTGTCSSGQCRPTNTLSCARYSCDAAGAACLTTCQTDAQCSAGSACFAGRCVDPSPACRSYATVKSHSLSGGSLSVRFAGLAGQDHKVQSTTDLSTWVDRGIVRADATGTVVFDGAPATQQSEFFRAYAISCP